METKLYIQVEPKDVVAGDEYFNSDSWVVISEENTGMIAGNKCAIRRPCYWVKTKEKLPPLFLKVFTRGRIGEAAATLCEDEKKYPKGHFFWRFELEEYKDIDVDFQCVDEWFKNFENFEVPCN